jgi:hypothetical protein
MGYAGYAPGANSRLADALSPLQQALRNLSVEGVQEILDLLKKLTENVVRNPGEEKFRRVRLTNAKIAAAVAESPAMLDVLKEMGWVEEDGVMVLPPSVRLAHEIHVIGIIDAKAWWKKEEENEKRRQMRARKETGADTDTIRKQLELDRQERAADGPVTRSSVPKQLGEGTKMTAGDIGIGKSSGG